MRVQQAGKGMTPAPIQRFLMLNGTGTVHVVADYSSTAGPVVFHLGPPAGSLWHIERMIMYNEGTGTLRADAYGVISGGLAVGIVVRYARTAPADGGAAQYYNLTDSLPIKSNGGSSRNCYDSQDYPWGAGPVGFGFRWTFKKGGAPLALDGDLGDRIEVVAHDDFTDLDDHTFKLNGTIQRGPTVWDS